MQSGIVVMIGLREQSMTFAQAARASATMRYITTCTTDNGVTILYAKHNREGQECVGRGDGTLRYPRQSYQRVLDLAPVRCTVCVFGARRRVSSDYLVPLRCTALRVIQIGDTGRGLRARPRESVSGVSLYSTH